MTGCISGGSARSGVEAGKAEARHPAGVGRCRGAALLGGPRGRAGSARQSASIDRDRGDGTAGLCRTVSAREGVGLFPRAGASWRRNQLGHGDTQSVRDPRQRLDREILPVLDALVVPRCAVQALGHLVLGDPLLAADLRDPLRDAAHGCGGTVGGHACTVPSVDAARERSHMIALDGRSFAIVHQIRALRGGD